MKAVQLLVSLLVATICAGCSLLPSWRVFQKRVDQKDTQTPPAQIEGQRAAAAFIAQATTPPVSDPGKIIQDVHEVASTLSASLGPPKNPAAVKDKDAVIKGLGDALLAKEAQLEKWKAFGRKYADKPLEGTGINLAGPAGGLLLVGIIAACIAFPPVGYVLLRVLPVLWSFFRRTTTSIAEFATSHPVAGLELKQRLGDNMDAVHKKLMKRFVKPTAAVAPAV